jgi:hypothetical protein
MSLQTVGRLGRKPGKEDINIHFRKPARFGVFFVLFFCLLLICMNKKQQESQQQQSAT